MTLVIDCALRAPYNTSIDEETWVVWQAPVPVVIDDEDNPECIINSEPKKSKRPRRKTAKYDDMDYVEPRKRGT